MLTQKSAIDIVRSFAREVNDSGIALKRVILFGSYASGKQHKWSDIDVALVSDEFESFGVRDGKLFVDIHIRKPFYDIQTKTYNTRDFDADKNPFVEEILKTGIEINIS